MRSATDVRDPGDVLRQVERLIRASAEWQCRVEVLADRVAALQAALLERACLTADRPDTAGGSPIRLQRWRFYPLRLVLPWDEVEAMWDRAEEFDLARGGRLSVRESFLLLWSMEPPRRIVGSASVIWGAPDPSEATLTRVGWVPDAGGSFEATMRVLTLLRGEPSQPTGLR